MFLELKSSTGEDLKTPSILPCFQLKFCKIVIFYIMSTDRGAPVKHDVTLQKSDDGEFQFSVKHVLEIIRMCV